MKITNELPPFFENGSVDVAIIDTPWNGVAESLEIAAIGVRKSTRKPCAHIRRGSGKLSP